MPVRVHSSVWFQPTQRWPFITSLIDDCFHNHKDCERRGRPFLPSRCIDIGMSEEDNIRVIHPVSEVGRYACLSHCWGTLGPATRLTKTSLRSLSQGLSISQLPKTFRDAVVVCQALGISYIWIDALCKFFTITFYKREAQQ